MAAFSFSLQAQTPKKVSLEDVFKKGTFSQKSVYGINWMKDGNYYSSLVQRNGAPTVVKIKVTTGEEVGVLLDGQALGIAFSDYSFNADESKALLATDVESIYRRSSKGIFYVVDMASGQKQQLMKGEKISYATLSPDNNQVAFVKDNNLYVPISPPTASASLPSMGKTTASSTGQQTGCMRRNFPWPKPSNGLQMARKLPLSDLTKARYRSSTCKPGALSTQKTTSLSTPKQVKKMHWFRSMS